ncbi:response regulator transcription factor [Streptomyces sp. NPDC001817]|uniref:response regulator transcription factor n=1 Tax=Streptomyces sp. NPDC001817 TaxID=3154398 RepID=UPI003331F76D
MQQARVTVVVADDHPVYREGLVRGLTMSGHIEVLAEVGDGRAALAAINEHHPDVAIVDYRLPELDGLAVLHAVVRDALPTRVLLLSAVTDSKVVFKAVQEGTAGYLPKDASRKEIIEAIMQVSRGQTVIPGELAGSLAGEVRLRAADDAPVLSERESQVLKAFARGLSIPQIANDLYLSPATVKSHVQRLYQKLGVSDRAAAVAIAMRRGMLE